jgi:hypothetical protein
MSTYSPSLRIELITTGTQAGTWGNTTNTNLGGLIEAAIAGYTSVSVIAANQALTALNGAPDESRHMTLALTTTTGAAFNVYAPPAEKTYVIYNASAHAATIFNSTVIGNTTAAGLGVAIPAGRTVTVWSDGTNFSFQNDHLASLTLASPLAAASGGTGLTALGTGVATFLGVPTSANLRAAVSDETGTGSLVFATSPTLVTPALGTPSSAVLTNATGLPNAGLVNSSVTINGNSVSLGGSTTITAVNPNALTIGTGLSGASYNGSSAVTVAIDSTVATLTGTQTLTNKTLTSPTLNSPTMTTPALGTPASGVMTNVTGLPLTTGVTGTLPVANGGTGVTTSTGSGSNVLSNSPTLVTPALGTPSSGNLANTVGLPIDGGTTGTLPVLRGGTGVTTSTGSGSNVLSNSPTLVTPALGTPSSGNLANCSFPTLNQNTTGNAATATNPQSGGSFITSSNIGSQSVAFAADANNANNANNATIATTATTANRLGTASGSAPSYSARAWVNFNAVGTIAIMASGNVSSITDNGAGLFAVNFTIAMPDANYAVAGGGQFDTSDANPGSPGFGIRRISGAVTASSANIVFNNGPNGWYPPIATAVFFR